MSLKNTPVNGYLGRQVLMMKPRGSDTWATPRSLNPQFVEALMGLPTGWTGFNFAATRFSSWLALMRCEFCWLDS